MAIKQLKFVKSNGKSALGIHEYIARLGENRDNADKCLVQGYEHLPEFARDDPLLFWKMADQHERANAKACTHVVVALPRELNVEAQTRMIEDFVQRNFKGCPLSWAIHEGKDQHNPHAHLQICERRIETEREARFSEKRFFKRNGVKKDRTLNERNFCSHLYRQYAGSINHHLQKAGSEARISVEAKNQEFEEMSISEKMKKNFDRELAELEKRQAEEMAELLKKLKKENEETKGEEDYGLRRGEQDFTGAESRDLEEVKNSGSELEPLSQESLSGGSNKSSGGSQERSQRSERYFEGLGGYNDSGNGGMESGTGSKEDAKSDQESATIGARLLELARTALKAIFRNKWLQKLKIFRRERLSEEYEQSQNQKVLDQKIVRGVKNSTFDLTMTAMKAESNRRSRRHEENLEVQKTIDRLRENFKESFINFQGLDVNKKYKTVVVARKEVKNIFGSLKHSQNIIIGFHTHYNAYNKRESTAQCNIEEVRNPKPKSNWSVYETKVEPGQNIEDLLNEKCRGFYFDRNLFQRENQVRREMQESIERHIEDLKKNGIRKSKIILTRIKPEEINKQNRGFRL